jgi:PAS domain S-box-containing protein
MDNLSLQILLVEDNPTDVFLLEDALEAVPAINFVLTHAERLDAALALPHGKLFDAVLLDLGLPDSQGLDTFTRMHHEHPALPILILSGLNDDDLAVCAVQKGAQDYLVKSVINSTMLARTIRYAIERKRSEQILKASEVGYRRLFETTQDGIFILNANTGQITDANPFLEKLLGYASAEFIGKRLWEIAPFRDRKANQAAFATLTETGYIVYSDLPLATKSGRFIDVEFVSNIYTVGDRQVIQCNIRDITERKRAETALIELSEKTARRERMLSTALSSISDFAQIYDREGRILFVNQPLLNLWGITLEEAMGKNFLDLGYPDELAERLQRQVQGVFEIGHRVTDETPYTSPTGQQGYYEYIFSPVFESDGTVDVVVGSTRDMTERKRIAQVLETTMLQLERSNNDLQHFASIASHDLQEPLRAIQAFADRLQTRHGAELNEEANDYLTRVQNAAARMRALIQDLLAYSRVTTKARPFTPVNLGATTETILADLVIRLEETGGCVEVGELPTIEADAIQMRQLFQNLIANALKFHRDDAPPHVKVYTQPPARGALKQAQHRVHIVVEDNGIGFDEKFVDRIFAPFERLHTQSKYPGTGIGLAICRKITERHGGSISVTSVPGQGSRFVIELPLRQSESGVALEGTERL